MCERFRNSARWAGWQPKQVSCTVASRSRPRSEVRLIGLWQSAAGEVDGLVRGARPVQARAARMTLQAHPVLFFDAVPALARERDDARAILGVLEVARGRVRDRLRSCGARARCAGSSGRSPRAACRPSAPPRPRGSRDRPPRRDSRRHPRPPGPESGSGPAPAVAGPERSSRNGRERIAWERASPRLTQLSACGARARSRASRARSRTESAGRAPAARRRCRRAARR